MNRSLWEIDDDLWKVNELLDEVEGDLSRFGEAEGAVTAWLDALGEEQAKKLDSYRGLIRHLTTLADAAKREADEWACKAKMLAKRRDYLKQRVQDHMERHGLTKILTAKGHSITLRANGGTAPLLLNDLTSDQIPEEYAKVTVEVDRYKVRKALEDGVEVPFARLGERGKHLVVG